MPRRKNGVIALETVKGECEAAITDIKSEKAAGTCHAHGAMARGLIALLRSKVAEIEYAEDVEQDMKKTVAKVTGVICVVGGIIYALLDHLDVIVGLFR